MMRFMILRHWRRRACLSGHWPWLTPAAAAAAADAAEAMSEPFCRDFCEDVMVGNRDEKSGGCNLLVTKTNFETLTYLYVLCLTISAGLRLGLGWCSGWKSRKSCRQFWTIWQPFLTKYMHTDITYNVFTTIPAASQWKCRPLTMFSLNFKMHYAHYKVASLYDCIHLFCSRRLRLKLNITIRALNAAAPAAAVIALSKRKFISLHCLV